ncbi:hypothetical protein PPGU19_046220 [Paraburkholderia sp. PGU19]|nr:hypothetical protein PPGU19_046220 [Paraburkholderia sp. PGU19]
MAMDRSNFRGNGVDGEHTHADAGSRCEAAYEKSGYESRANALRRVLSPTTLNRMHEE